MCFLRVSCLVNAAKHWGQTNGFSPVWVRMCLFKSDLSLKSLLQKVQTGIGVADVVDINWWSAMTAAQLVVDLGAKQDSTNREAASVAATESSVYTHVGDSSTTTSCRLSTWSSSTSSLRRVVTESTHATYNAGKKRKSSQTKHSHRRSSDKISEGRLQSQSMLKCIYNDTWRILTNIIVVVLYYAVVMHALWGFL